MAKEMFMFGLSLSLVWTLARFLFAIFCCYLSIPHFLY